jgi:ferredoxin
MKNRIYYFTGTGNSLVVARDLAKELGEAELVSIAKVVKEKNDVSDLDYVGIVFPVYDWSMPFIVEDFIKTLSGAEGKYFFAVATYGGFTASALEYVKNALKKQGVKSFGGFGVKMPGNYIPLYGAKPEDQQKKMFEAEKSKIKLIADRIKNREEKSEKSFILLNLIFDMLSSRIRNKLRVGYKEFWVDDKCISCGTCEKICPVNNVKLSDGKPTWGDKCEQCMACIQWCPKEAIQHGKNSQKKKRYSNPKITVEDMIEARGSA